MEGVAYESEEEEEDEDEEEEDGEDEEDEDEKINELVNIFNHCILVLFYANQTVWFFLVQSFILFINMFSNHIKQQCFWARLAQNPFLQQITSNINGISTIMKKKDKVCQFLSLSCCASH